MLVAIAGKMGSAALFSGTSAVFIVCIIDQELLGIYSNVHLYVISTKIVPPAQSLPDNKKDFQCKFKVKNNTSTDLFKCKIYEINDKDNKQLKINDLIQNENRKIVDKENTFLTEHKIFQVQFKSKHWSKGENFTKQLEIITKDATVKTYSNFTHLFAIYKGKKITSSQYFIVKASKEKETVSGTNINKCYFDQNTEDKNQQECEIFDFADSEQGADESSGYGSLTFKHPVDKSTSIDKNKHYLIKFKDSVEFEKIKNGKIYGRKDGNKVNFINANAAFYDKNFGNIFIF